MGMVQNQICDNCGRILFGKDRAANVSRDALEIKGGTIKTQRVDEVSKWRQYEYISPYRDADLAFCIDNEKANPFECFTQYVVNAEARKRNERERELREGASREQLELYEKEAI